ncbi:N-acetyl-alpha-D-glucosaminyl L-malate synthase BshA [Tetzosporium hominis]|uniref:N-acetyl-alpha-D-glucosaminyl L-malate synthase BshA n=1 Tax=Tetzosporium hominis TaxID=2020506 RepID=A0A264W786_9BACL|nr:N-acetyl-alpha-D-glucosaminyl L-malate synthase BshA [Tetzosporium hominis]
MDKKKKLKIGITCYPTVGGSGIIATELGKQLAERGHEIHFITSSMPFRLKGFYQSVTYHEVEVNNYSVFQYAPYDIALANKIAEVIDDEQLDVLHMHYAIPHAVCAILARDMAKRNVGIVTTLHGTDITVLGVDSSLKGAIRYGIEKSDVVTAVSNSLAKQTMELIAPEKQIETIYNFIDTEDYYPQDVSHLRKVLGIAPEEKVLLHVSNFRKVKRVQDIVKTFSYVRKQMPCKLVLVGDGPERHPILEQAKGTDYEQDILFLGKQENVAELYALADLFLLMSEKESFGLVLLEAMACGVPCIGTDIGGIPEVIRHGENGFIVPSGAVEKAALLIVELLNNPEMYAAFRQQALETVEKTFNNEQIITQYEDFYYQVAPNED